MASRQKDVKTLIGPMIQAGTHEPLSFRRRTGNVRANEVEIWEREHSEELVEKLARRGVTWVRAHFFKGNGLQAEAPEIELTRRFVRLCHKHGIKVQLYTQFGTLQYETFLAEEPDMRDWACVNEHGELVRIRYGHQGFRFKPCFVRDGYWEYFKKVLRLAIEDVGGDGFGFDNIEGPMEPDSCHCPECRAAFVAFLKERYPTPEQAEERFGFAILDHIAPPVFNRFNPPITCRAIRDPVMQEWMAFRCENMRRRFEEIWRYVKERKPDMMIEYNVYPPFGKNGPFWQGIDMLRLGPFLNMFYNERDPGSPEFDPDEGILWHRVHGYKLGQAIGAEAVITGNGGRSKEQRELAVAEALVFNQGHITRIGRLDAVADGHLPEADPFIAFRTEHADLFEDATSAAQVGLFESAASRANNSVGPYVSGVLAMNGLLAGHLPFDLVTALDEEAFDRYAVLVLPNVECLSDAECRGLMDYVAAGGGAVLTGLTSSYDEWRRRRPAPGLEEMLRDAAGYGRLGGLRPDTALRGEFGEGRFVYLRRLTTPAPFDDFERCTDGPNIHPKAWRVPLNQRAFVDGVRWAAADRLTPAVAGPTGLAAEARRTPDGRLVLHLVNYCLGDGARNVEVSLTARSVEAARLWTPWGKTPDALRRQQDGSAVRVVVGTIPRYGLLEIDGELDAG
ncbi:MAG: beta-galactosidase [Planctomycetota bacterium]